MPTGTTLSPKSFRKGYPYSAFASQGTFSPTFGIFFIPTNSHKCYYHTKDQKYFFHLNLLSVAY